MKTRITNIVVAQVDRNESGDAYADDCEKCGSYTEREVSWKEDGEEVTAWLCDKCIKKLKMIRGERPKVIIDMYYTQDGYEFFEVKEFGSHGHSIDYFMYADSAREYCKDQDYNIVEDYSQD